MNTICQSLVEGKCRGLPPSHAVISLHNFLAKGRSHSEEAWKAYFSATTAFQYAAENPFQILDLASTVFQTLERFTCVLYNCS